MAEMVSQFKRQRQRASLKRRALKEDVPCDLCPEPKLKALKSCVLCMASYCSDHLQPHISNTRLKRHQLIQASKNLEENFCPQHDAPLQMFCRSESKVICLQCFCDQHKNHDVVTLTEQRKINQEKLKEVIQNRRKKIEEIENSVELSLKNANTEIKNGVEVFTSLMKCVQKSQDMFKQVIKEKHAKIVKRAGMVIPKIQKEIEDLEENASELSRFEDFSVLQKFSSIKHSEDDQPTVRKVQYSRVLVNSLHKLLYETYSRECRKVFKARLNRLKRSKLEVFQSKNKNIKDSLHTLRFTNESVPCVMGSKGFSTGQFYFEVEVKDKLQWAVGVVNKSLLHDRSQMWLMTWDNGKFHPATVRDKTVSVKSIPKKIGVFVNYRKHIVAFYDVQSAVRIGLIKNCKFIGEIWPLFGFKDESNKMEIDPKRLQYSQEELDEEWHDKYHGFRDLGYSDYDSD